MKQYTTTVKLKYSDPPVSGGVFSTADVFEQAMSGKDIHTFAGQTEIFIPKDSIAKMTFSVTDSESEAPTDEFCGGEA